jgi:antitoxin VapB
VFWSGKSQAVRLPKEFRLKSKEVEIFRRGDEIVLREKGKGLARAFEILANPPDDFLTDGRQGARHSGGTASARSARINLQGSKGAPLHIFRACSAASGRQLLT